MSKWDRVDLAALGACCVGAIHQRPQLAAEGDVMCCPQCPAVLVVTGGVWGRYAGFAARFGVVPWDRHMGRRYPRDGRCELCGRTTAEVAADLAAPWRNPPGDDRNAHLRVLMFDHCHTHAVTRGLLCLGCNNDMALFDKGLPARHAPRRVAYAQNCPPCRAAEPALAVTSAPA